MHTVLGLMFARNHAADRRALWRSSGSSGATLLVDLARTVDIRILDLREDVRTGQVVSRYAVDGEVGGTWQRLSEGPTIGHRKLDRLEVLGVRRLRVTITDAVERPFPISLGCYG